jgi:hypothetical protein
MQYKAPIGALTSSSTFGYSKMDRGDRQYFISTKETIKIEKGQKIAQAVVCPVVSGKWVTFKKVENIEDKDRSDKGFGSTGI